MHEMALADNIIDIIEREARRARLVQVRQVRVGIGSLAVVMPEALQAAFDAASARTLADGARLVMETEPGIAWCAGCATAITIHDALDACPGCGGYDWHVTGGNSLRVIDIEGTE